MDTCEAFSGSEGEASQVSRLGEPSATPGEHHGFVHERLNLVVVGHVDHGKSTIVGRLLADTDSLPDGKLEQIRLKCDAAGKRFEYAFLLDALIDEQAQGITIDTARVFFKSAKRHYIILDAPGHIEFLRNMITGTSHAEAALLVIDANEGIKENSRRHGYMLSMLSVKHVIVLVNKMDLVGYNQEVFENVVKEYSEFLNEIGAQAQLYIPVSGLNGDNIVERSASIPWYSGPTVLSALDDINPPTREREETLRLYIQDIFKFTKYGDERRIIAGTLDSGSLSVGDTIVLYPSGKKTQVASIESFNTPPRSTAFAGEAVGFTMSEQLYASRGELISRVGDRPPKISTRVQVSIFWLGREPLTTSSEFIVKIGTIRMPAKIEKISRIVDAGDLSLNIEPKSIERNNVAECTLLLAKPLVFDEREFLSTTSRFVIVENYRISGGGIIRKALSDERTELRQRAVERDEKWIRSLLSPVERAERYAQSPVLIAVTGATDSPRKELAKALEARLFREGRTVYFLGMGNIVYGLDQDLDGQAENRHEHIRRLAEVGNLMLDAGLILIVSAAELGRGDVGLIQELVGAGRVRIVEFSNEKECVGDIVLPMTNDLEVHLQTIKQALARDRFFFSPGT